MERMSKALAVAALGIALLAWPFSGGGAASAGPATGQATETW